MLNKNFNASQMVQRGEASFNDCTAIIQLFN